MAVNIRKLDGSNEEVVPKEGKTCKEQIVEDGLISAPDNIWNVQDGQGRVVDNEPIINFDGQKLVINKKVAPGGRN